MLLVLLSAIADADINAPSYIPLHIFASSFCNVLVMLSSGVDSESFDF